MFESTLLAHAGQLETKNNKEDDQTLWAGQMFPNPAVELIHIFATLKAGLKDLVSHLAGRLDQNQKVDDTVIAIASQQPLTD